MDKKKNSAFLEERKWQKLLYQNFPISFDYQLMEQQEMLPEQHLQAKTIPSLHKMENYFFL